VTLNSSGVKTPEEKSLYVAAEAATHKHTPQYTHKHFDFFRSLQSQRHGDGA
jgi:predicted metal-dependent phosphotriesterase family hydrolase